MGPNTKTILDPALIAKFIDEGNAIVVYGNAVLKLDTWLKYHPGGDKTILHLVGRDATDQIDAYFLSSLSLFL